MCSLRGNSRGRVGTPRFTSPAGVASPHDVRRPLPSTGQPALAARHSCEFVGFWDPGAMTDPPIHVAAAFRGGRSTRCLRLLDEMRHAAPPLVATAEVPPHAETVPAAPRGPKLPNHVSHGAHPHPPANAREWTSMCMWPSLSALRDLCLLAGAVGSEDGDGERRPMACSPRSVPLPRPPICCPPVAGVCSHFAMSIRVCARVGECAGPPIYLYADSL